MAWLDSSRTLAVFAVIVVHVAAGAVNDNAVDTDAWWIGNVCDSLARWCVPVFAMISGALLLDPAKHEDLVAFYRKRASKIALPLLAWSAFYLGWSALKGTVKGEQLSVGDLADMLFAGRPYYHMWYLYMLPGLYAFTPFLRMIVAIATPRDLIVLTALSFALATASQAHNVIVGAGPGLFLNWFLLYIPYALSGYLIRRGHVVLSMRMATVLFMAAATATAFGYYGERRRLGSASDTYFYSYLSITVIPMAISILCLIKDCSPSAWNGRAEKAIRRISILSFGIYLVHPAVLDVMAFLGVGATCFHPALAIPLVSGALFSLSLCVAWFLEQTPYLRRII